VLPRPNCCNNLVFTTIPLFSWCHWSRNHCCYDIIAIMFPLPCPHLCHSSTVDRIPCCYPIASIALLSRSYYVYNPINFTILLSSRSEFLPYGGSSAEIGWLWLQPMDAAAKLPFFLELSLQ
jgi:hypothetical protein